MRIDPGVLAVSAAITNPLTSENRENRADEMITGAGVGKIRIPPTLMGVGGGRIRETTS